MTGRACRFALHAVLLFLLFAPVYAQSITDAQVQASSARIDALNARLKSVRALLTEGTPAQDDLDAQRTAIESIKLDITAEATKLQGPLSEVEAQMARLGPPPGDGQTETAAIAAQRRILTGRSAQLAAEQKQLELLALEASQSLNRIGALQRAEFFERIFKSEKSALNPRLWLELFSGFGHIGQGVGAAVSQSFGQITWSMNLLGLLIFPIGALIVFSFWSFVTRKLKAKLPRGTGTEFIQMSALQRLWQVFIGLLVLFIAVQMLAILFFASLHAADLLTDRFHEILNIFADAIISTLFSTGLMYLICSPRRPAARLIAIDDRSAQILPPLVGAAVFSLEYGRAVSRFSEPMQLPLSVLPAQSALSAGAMILLVGMIVALLQRQARSNQAEGASYVLAWFVRFFPVLWILLGISTLALILGYISLAYFIASNLIQTALFVVCMGLLRNFTDAVAEAMQNPLSSVNQVLRRFTSLGEVGLSRLALMFRTIVDIAIVFILLPILFFIWAAAWFDVPSLYSWLLNGFTVGNITLSPWGLFVAILVLLIGITATRILTNWLQLRVLSETTLDKGVQDSVRTATSYLGYIIAVAFALSAAGLDFSNIAIIAGALGVGIGFGLQSIVNNFVSGLILLAERPIRVGDWVQTNDGEGIVKKINVRSTEIETFDSCTVIVPNSALITGAVKNWTHRDTVGRFTVSLIVTQDADPDTVVEIMKTAARGHSAVLRYPEPQILLTRFQAPGWEFQLKGHVADVFQAAAVASDIRFEIASEFKKQKIQTATA